jgi:hypothetical protein
VHTFLPIQFATSIDSGDNLRTAVRRAQYTPVFKTHIQAEIDSIESFKQTSLVSLNTAAAALTSALSAATTDKLENIRRAVETAKQEALDYAQQTLQESGDPSKHATNILMLKVTRRNGRSLRKLKCFCSEHTETDCLSQLSQFSGFTMNLPSSLLGQFFIDSRLAAKDCLKIGLLKNEVRFKRKGHECDWSISGSPKVDAFAFQSTKKIWLTGLGLGASCFCQDVVTVSDVEVRKGKGTRGELVYRHPGLIQLLYDGTEEGKFVKVQFAKPVLISKKAEFCIRVCYSSLGQVWGSEGDIRQYSKGTKFVFKDAVFEGGDVTNKSTGLNGPVRDLCYSTSEIKLGP